MNIKKVLVTGANGFFGKNLCVALERYNDLKVFPFDVNNSTDELEQYVAQVDFIFHLAGVNRPKSEIEFTEGNTDLTRQLCGFAEKKNTHTPILLSSSTQSEQDNAYGRSKKAAEEILISYSRRSKTPVLIYRFPNLFGKWSRPNYNSVVSTFCYNATHDLPLQVNNPAHTVIFAYIDDVVKECLRQMEEIKVEDWKLDNRKEGCYYEITDTYSISLGHLAELVKAFRAVREGGPVPDLSNSFTKKLYSTFLSYYDMDALAYPTNMNLDNRGWLFELIKSEQFGQIFVSKTHPGITRGNHGHDTKVEKFCVIQGRGIIRFRQILTKEIIEYEVSGEKIKVVDIPPGYTHSIENIGADEMITLFWANEIFNPDKPDTYFEEVLTTNSRNEELVIYTHK